MLSAYIGYWEDYLSLAVMPEDEPWLRAMGTIGVVIQDRDVLLVPNVPASKGGRAPAAIESARHGGLTLQCRWPLEPKPWVRFMRHEVAVEVYSETADLCEGLSFYVPQDYAAPYPRLYNVGTFDTATVAYREMHRRLCSAAQAGGEDLVKRTIQNVPDHFRRHLSRPAWATIINEAMSSMRG